MSLLDDINQKNANRLKHAGSVMQKRVAQQNAPSPFQAEQQHAAERKQILASAQPMQVKHLPATPEQQTQRKQLSLQAKQMMFTEGKSEALGKALMSDSNPKRAVANVAHDIISVMEKKNSNADPMAMGETLMDVIDDLAEFSQTLRQDAQFDDDDMSDIFSQVAETYMRSRPNEFSKDEIRRGLMS